MTATATATATATRQALRDLDPRNPPPQRVLRTLIRQARIHRCTDEIPVWISRTAPTEPARLR